MKLWVVTDVNVKRKKVVYMDDEDGDNDVIEDKNKNARFMKLKYPRNMSISPCEGGGGKPRLYERCKESYENNLYDNDDYQCDNLTPEQTTFYDVFDIRFLVSFFYMRYLVWSVLMEQRGGGISVGEDLFSDVSEQGSSQVIRDGVNVEGDQSGIPTRISRYPSVDSVTILNHRHAGTCVYGFTYEESIWSSGGEAFVTEKYKTSITNKGNTGGIPINSTKPVVILGVSIKSNEELIRLVKRIESDALDDVISELTTAEHDATHALVLELERGIDYVNSDSDTPSEEPNRVTPSVVSHIDESPIIQSVSFQDKHSSYIGAVRRSSFARCLIEINADDVLKERLTMGVLLIEGSGVSIKMVSIYYDWRPPQCDICKIFGHVHDQCPNKSVQYEPNAAINVPKMVVSNVVNTDKSGSSHAPSMSKN
uniref:Zinc knuckle CX2CX4HX4C n=1 Tax=Tanacetum cinerariifolium TaxID=118510 RepID=A0A6L2P1G2_TANCI|nr:zinc knuckle CX2CX4HX4C [Tanacetum cinerariifolium]